MDIKELRVENLKSFIKSQGGAAKIAKEHDGIDASYLSQLVNKHRPFGEKSARRMESILGLAQFYFDQAMDNIDTQLPVFSRTIREEIKDYKPIKQSFKDTIVSLFSPADNFASIPLMNSTASMGSGSDLVESEVVIDVLRISKDWLDRTMMNITNISNLAFIHGIGDSMSPTFNDGDILLVDTGISTVKADGVYVLEAHQRLFIKRVRQRLDSAYEISSDNPTVKTSDVLNGDHQVSIKGRVVWVWNGKRI